MSEGSSYMWTLSRAAETTRGDPLADWKREQLIALKEAWPRTTLVRQSTVAISQVFRCGEMLQQCRDRFTENRTHHVGTVPAV